jgi:anti-anti-sigma factor
MGSVRPSYENRGPAGTWGSAELRVREDQETPVTVEADGAEPLLTAGVVRTRDETVAVAVRGEIDLQTADDLRFRLLDLAQSGYRVLVVDFAGVSFCDAAGLGALVAAYNRVRAGGGEVRLSRVRPAQRRLLRVTGLHRVFALYDDLDGAIDGPSAWAASPRS